MTSRLIALNVYWWMLVQGGKLLLPSFLVSGIKIEVCSTKAGRKVVMYQTSPRNCQTCFTDLGAGQLRIWDTFVMSTSMPCSEMSCPRKSISVAKSVDFLGEQYSSAALSASRTTATFLQCSVIENNQMMMSSKYMWQIFLIKSFRARVMQRW